MRLHHPLLWVDAHQRLVFIKTALHTTLFRENPAVLKHILSIVAERDSPQCPLVDRNLSKIDDPPLGLCHWEAHF